MFNLSSLVAVHSVADLSRHLVKDYHEIQTLLDRGNQLRYGQPPPSPLLLLAPPSAYPRHLSVSLSLSVCLSVSVGVSVMHHCVLLVSVVCRLLLIMLYDYVMLLLMFCSPFREAMAY